MRDEADVVEDEARNADEVAAVEEDEEDPALALGETAGATT